MGPNGSGKSTLSHVLMGHPGYEVTAGEVTFKGADLLELRARRALARSGSSCAFQYPHAVPGVTVANFLRTGRQRAPQGRARRRRQPDLRQEFRQAAAGAHGAARGRPLDVEPLPQRRVLRRREEAPRDPADGDARSPSSRSSTRPTPASTSTPCGSSPRASTRCVGPEMGALVITHYQRILDYITARPRAHPDGWPDRPLRRSRARARARAERLRGRRPVAGGLNMAPAREPHRSTSASTSTASTTTRSRSSRRARGLDEDVVREISAHKGEPAVDARLSASRRTRSSARSPCPRWGADLSRHRLREHLLLPEADRARTRARWDDVPEDIKNTFERLGIPEAERSTSPASAPSTSPRSSTTTSRRTSRTRASSSCDTDQALHDSTRTCSASTGRRSSRRPTTSSPR